jgi:hypothetical protein
MSTTDKRPETADLFDAALCQCRRSFGPRERPNEITIVTAAGLRCVLNVPHYWEIETTEEGQPKLPNPGAIADLLHLIVDVGHRMTRDQVREELSKRKKRRADSVVGDTLALLVRLGVLDNRQDVAPNGFGLREWTD